MMTASDRFLMVSLIFLLVGCYYSPGSGKDPVIASRCDDPRPLSYPIDEDGASIKDPVVFYAYFDTAPLDDEEPRFCHWACDGSLVPINRQRDTATDGSAASARAPADPPTSNSPIGRVKTNSGVVACRWSTRCSSSTAQVTIKAFGPTGEYRVLRPYDQGRLKCGTHERVTLVRLPVAKP